MVDLTERPRGTLLAAILVGSVARLSYLRRSLERLSREVVASDAFYYFVLARRIAAGEGVVFNTGVPTNGFHPLYAAVLVPIYELLPGFGPPLRAAVAIGAAVSVLTAVPIYLLGAELRSETAGLVGALCWLLNPFVIDLSVLGMEVPFQVFFAAAFSWFAVSRSLTDPGRGTVCQWVVAGVLLGFAFLGRMDMAMLAVGFFGVVAVGLFRGATQLRNLTGPIIGGTTATAVITPWLAWSLTTVGRLTPASGAALRWELRSYPERYGSYLDTVAVAALATGEDVWSYFLHVEPGTYLGKAAVSLLALVLLASLVASVRRSDELRSFVGRVDFFVVTGVLYYAFYVFYQTDVRGWYALFTTFLLTVLVAVGVDATRTWSGIGRERLARAVIVSLLLSGAVSVGVQTVGGEHDEEHPRWTAARYVGAELPEGTVVGSYNADIYQYYAPGVEVLNLDGLMNPEALEARRDGRMAAYLCAEDAEYLLDPARDVAHLNRSREPVRETDRRIDLRRVETFGGADTTVYYLYRIESIEGCQTG
ncbi:MAG: ArnT family glycosyltransferase [Haloarculaceae archaeon]